MQEFGVLDRKCHPHPTIRYYITLFVKTNCFLQKVARYLATPILLSPLQWNVTNPSSLKSLKLRILTFHCLLVQSSVWWETKKKSLPPADIFAKAFHSSYFYSNQFSDLFNSFLLSPASYKRLAQQKVSSRGLNYRFISPPFFGDGSETFCRATRNIVNASYIIFLKNCSGCTSWPS